MAQQRFDLRREPDGTWSVVDVFTGWPTDPAVGLEFEEADELVDMLNFLEAKHKKPLRQP